MKKKAKAPLTPIKPASTVAAHTAPTTKGPITMATTETRETAPKAPKNGTTQAAAPAAAETEEKAAARRGVIPTMPAAILYALPTGKVIAAIYHPTTGDCYQETGKGAGSAKGALEDSGFVLSGQSMDGPEWLAEKLPAGCTLIGYCTIKGFPLPSNT